MYRRTAVMIALLALPPLQAHAQNASGTYAVAKRISIGLDGGWDYLTVDTVGGRLYVSHGTRVMAVDLARDSVVGTIDSTLGVHGIAIAPELGRGFISDGRDSTMTIFDLRTLARLGRVNVGAANPDAILYEPSTQRVFTFNGRSGNATVFDAAAGTIVGTIPLGGKPEFAVHDGAGTVFVNIEDSSQVVAIDPRAMRVTARWSLAPCQEPSGLAIDRVNRRLFSACDNRTMAISDADAHRVVRTVPIGEGVDGAAFDPGPGLAFSSNGEGTITVVREVSRDSFVVAQTVTTQRGARTIAVDPRTHRLFLPTAEFGPTPAATADNPRPRPSLVPGSFVVLVVQRS